MASLLVVAISESKIDVIDVGTSLGNDNQLQVAIGQATQLLGMMGRLSLLDQQHLVTDFVVHQFIDSTTSQKKTVSAGAHS